MFFCGCVKNKMNNKYITNYLNSANKHILAGQDVFKWGELCWVWAQVAAIIIFVDFSWWMVGQIGSILLVAQKM